MPAADPRATVVVVNWNGAHLLPDCLTALARQDLPPGSWRTVVVDNASSDDSAALLRRDFPDVTVIENPRNDGFAGGNNVALRSATTPFSVLLNNDARPAADWLRQLLAPFEHDPALGAVTSKVLFLPRYVEVELEAPPYRAAGDGRELGIQVGSVAVDGVDVTDDVLWESSTYPVEGVGEGRFRWTRPRGSFLVPLVAASGEAKITVRAWAQGGTEAALSVGGVTSVLALGTEPSEHVLSAPATQAVDVVNNAGGLVLPEGYGADRGFQEVDRGQYEEPVEVFTACGAAMALRTEAVQQVGCFDDDFFLYYEDCDLSWRLRAAGWTVRYEPTAVVRHIHSASTGEWSPLFTFHVDRNRLLLLTKDATLSLAVREVLRYPLTTASLALQQTRRALASGHRPPVRATLLRLRVIASYLRLLPRMLARRRQVQRYPVKAAALQRRWLAPR
jgi:GT2 family glycosyltransferase